MKKITQDYLKNAEFPQSRSFKAGLKEQLLTRAEREYAPKKTLMKTLFRLSISFAIVALLVTQVGLPGESENSLRTFIQQANAANELHSDEIYYSKNVQTYEMYFDNPGQFTGWKTTSESTQEIWIAPNGDARYQSDSTHRNGPLEDGNFEEVSSSDTGMYLQDSYGNFIDYTLLEQIGTTTGDEYGEVAGEPIYNVHPDKQHSYEELESHFLNQVTCVQSEPGEDFTGYAWAELQTGDNSVNEVKGTAYANEPKYTLLDEMDDAISGRLSTSEVIDLFETLQDDPVISYKEKDGEYFIRLNQKDFQLISSNSKEGLSRNDMPDVFVTFTFNTDFRLTEMSSVTSYKGVEKERGSLRVIDSKYLAYETNASLFTPTEDYIAGTLTTRFDDDISQFEDGCYYQYEKVPDEEASGVIETLKASFDEMSNTLWEHPLKVALSYYMLPGDTTVHEVK